MALYVDDVDVEGPRAPAPAPAAPGLPFQSLQGAQKSGRRQPRPTKNDSVQIFGLGDLSNRAGNHYVRNAENADEPRGVKHFDCVRHRVTRTSPEARNIRSQREIYRRHIANAYRSVFFLLETRQTFLRHIHLCFDSLSVKRLRPRSYNFCSARHSNIVLGIWTRRQPTRTLDTEDYDAFLSK
jgi:hypothetical protein